VLVAEQGFPGEFRHKDGNNIRPWKKSENRIILACIYHNDRLHFECRGKSRGPAAIGATRLFFFPAARPDN
jgi:hypothetical protein